ncbi:hypothetical protein GCM10027049_29380 [Mucilaginibacter puniceus]
MNKKKNFQPIALAIGLLFNSAVLMAQAPQSSPASASPQAAQTYPGPFDRDGANKVLENDRVIVWEVSWLPKAYPTHQHQYDYAGVYYTNGDRVVVSPQGQRSPTHSTAWDTFFYRRGVTHSEEGVGTDVLRAVFLELKEPAAQGGATTASTGLGKEVGRPNNRLITWADIAEPGTQLQAQARKYENDAVVVAFTGQKPKITFVKRGTASQGKETAGADRAYTFELK